MEKTIIILYANSPDAREVAIEEITRLLGRGNAGTGFEVKHEAPAISYSAIVSVEPDDRRPN